MSSKTSRSQRLASYRKKEQKQKGTVFLTEPQPKRRKLTAIFFGWKDPVDGRPWALARTAAFECASTGVQPTFGMHLPAYPGDFTLAGVLRLAGRCDPRAHGSCYGFRVLGSRHKRREWPDRRALLSNHPTRREATSAPGDRPECGLTPVVHRNGSSATHARRTVGGRVRTARHPGLSY